MSKRNFRGNSSMFAHHVGLKGHNSKNVFFTDDDRWEFLEGLQHACEEYDVELLAYALMDNHVHLILFGDIEQFQYVFESLGATFARPLNQKEGGSGAVWTQRYYDVAIETQEQFLRTAAYVFNNPVVEGMCENPQDYEWSNFAELVAGEGGEARKRIDELVCVENLIEYTQSVKNKKLTNRELLEISLIEKKRVIDADLYVITAKHVGVPNIRKISKQKSHVQQAIVRDMWDYGANIHQISRVTGLSRTTVKRIIG